jgi:hypothetical protein
MSSPLTDWIGAIATAIGAVGTAGALWVGAITLRRPNDDQRRIQAENVTIGMKNGEVRLFNGNDVTIFVFVVAWRPADAATWSAVCRPRVSVGPLPLIGGV